MALWQLSRPTPAPPLRHVPLPPQRCRRQALRWALRCKILCSAAPSCRPRRRVLHPMRLPSLKRTAQRWLLQWPARAQRWLSLQQGSARSAAARLQLHRRLAPRCIRRQRPAMPLTPLWAAASASWPRQALTAWQPSPPSRQPSCPGCLCWCGSVLTTTTGLMPTEVSCWHAQGANAHSSHVAVLANSSTCHI